jgi:hypothetical protein
LAGAAIEKGVNASAMEPAQLLEKGVDPSQFMIYTHIAAWNFDHPDCPPGSQSKPRG